MYKRRFFKHMLIHEDAQGGRKMIEGSIFYWLTKPLFLALQKPKKKARSLPINTQQTPQEKVVIHLSQNTRRGATHGLNASMPLPFTLPGHSLSREKKIIYVYKLNGQNTDTQNLYSPYLYQKVVVFDFIRECLIYWGYKTFILTNPLLFLSSRFVLSDPSGLERHKIS